MNSKFKRVCTFYLLSIMFGSASCDFLKYILWPNMDGSGLLYITIFAICLVVKESRILIQRRLNVDVVLLLI